MNISHENFESMGLVNSSGSYNDFELIDRSRKSIDRLWTLSHYKEGVQGEYYATLSRSKNGGDFQESQFAVSSKLTLALIEAAGLRPNPDDLINGIGGLQNKYKDLT